MKRLKYKKYKKHKNLIKDSIKNALRRNSDRAKEYAEALSTIRLYKDVIKAEQELGEQ